jgi:hypothetical protein
MTGNVNTTELADLLVANFAGIAHKCPDSRKPSPIVSALSIISQNKFAQYPCSGDAQPPKIGLVFGQQ